MVELLPTSRARGQAPLARERPDSAGARAEWLGPAAPCHLVPAPRVLVIDNYDSFTFNLVQGLAVAGAAVHVVRNDAITPDEVGDLGPTHLVLSPGPGRPTEAGVTLDMVQRFAGRVPILGVCLGHQAIALFLGARIVRARRVVHGKTSLIAHDGRGVFRDLPTPFAGARYHSLVVDAEGLPPGLEVSARSDDGEIMAVRRGDLALEGVQFHPESFLTAHGQRLLYNFIGARC